MVFTWSKMVRARPLADIVAILEAQTKMQEEFVDFRKKSAKEMDVRPLKFK